MKAAVLLNKAKQTLEAKGVKDKSTAVQLCWYNLDRF